MKYLDFVGLSFLIRQLKGFFSKIGHTHTTFEITDYVVDSVISSTSSNPVENKAVFASLDEKALKTTTINNYPLVENINLTFEDVGADEKGAAERALLEAKRYTDAEFSESIGLAPETLNTIEKLAVAFLENEDVVAILDAAITYKADVEHTHTTSDITDYTVDQELSSASNNPVSNHVLHAKFNEISNIEDAHKKEIDELIYNTSEHFDSTIDSEDGSHGLRYYDSSFELFRDGFWQKISDIAQPMTIAIDLSNSNPNSCCTYEGKATSMTARSEEWDKFFGYYPVLMKNGQEVVRLNPNDYSRDLDGNPVDITSGNAGDVMIAFPRRGLKIYTTDNVVRVSFTGDSNNPDFKYYAHQYNGNDLDKFYVGAYEGFIDDNGALRSLSGKEPTVNVSLLETRIAARTNGNRYEQLAFYQLLYLQCVYLMKYRSLDSQTALGRGRVHYDGDYENEEDKIPATTGTMNTVGLDYGTQTGYEGVKFAGIEHTWGSCYKWVDGCMTDESRNYQFTTDTFGSANANYITVETVFTENSSGYLRTPIGTSEGGFLSNGSGGSSTTYFSDMQFCNASRIANYGGNWDVNDMGGAFLISFYDQSNEPKPHVCGRLMKL